MGNDRKAFPMQFHLLADRQVNCCPSKTSEKLQYTCDVILTLSTGQSSRGQDSTSLTSITWWNRWRHPSVCLVTGAWEWISESANQLSFDVSFSWRQLRNCAGLVTSVSLVAWQQHVRPWKLQLFGHVIYYVHTKVQGILGEKDNNINIVGEGILRKLLRSTSGNDLKVTPLLSTYKKYRAPLIQIASFYRSRGFMGK